MAKKFEAARIGTTGKATPDVETHDLVIEVKNVNEAGIRGSWIESIKKKGSLVDKEWVLVKRKKGEHSQVAVIDFDYFLRLRNTQYHKSCLEPLGIKLIGGEVL